MLEVFAGLVVLGIAALIFFPVFACACGGGSKSTICMSNLKQSGLAVAMYANDYDERYPKAEVWIDRLMPYSKSDRIYQDVEGIKVGTYGYAFRKTASSINQDNIPNQAAFIILFDSSLTGRNATSELWSLPHPGRHKGGDTVCFADFHAKRFSLGDESKPDQVSPLQTALIADDNAGPNSVSGISPHAPTLK
jgi:hypothetical protein